MEIVTPQRVLAPVIAPVLAATSIVGPMEPGTEMPAAAVVIGVGEGTSLSPGPGRAPIAPGDVSERRVTIDEETREIVTQAVDARTRQVLSQAPDQSLLALRAYFDRLSDKAGATKAGGDGLELVTVA